MVMWVTVAVRSALARRFRELSGPSRALRLDARLPLLEVRAHHRYLTFDRFLGVRPPALRGIPKFRRGLLELVPLMFESRGQLFPPSLQCGTALVPSPG